MNRDDWEYAARAAASLLVLLAGAFGIAGLFLAIFIKATN